MRRIVLAALAIAAWPAAAQEPPASAEDLFPLAVGNTWTYRVGGQDDKFVVRAARQEMVGSQTCILLEARLRDRVVATEHVAFTKDGLCRFKVEQTEVVPPVCVLKVPAPPRGWTAKYTLNQRPGTFTFTTRSEEVVYLARRYKATVVEARPGEVRGPTPPRTTVWYAPGVGPVKQRIDEGKGRFLELDLEKFEKAGGK